MVAQFDTADFLVVINRLEYTPVVTRSSVLGDYYDTKYDSKAIKRTATVKVNARILDKDGRIMWTRNIAEQKADLLLPKLAPPPQVRRIKTTAKTPQSVSYPIAAEPTQSKNAVVTGVDSISDTVETAKDTVETVKDIFSSGTSLINAISK
ncbi:MAG: hypothetical protein D3905_01100 [Candidatus Electrothrix sp. AS4_5]|nr:hypothetical protein [Candidatus Electrothrix gigas]